MQNDVLEGVRSVVEVRVSSKCQQVEGEAEEQMGVEVDERGCGRKSLETRTDCVRFTHRIGWNETYQHAEEVDWQDSASVVYDSAFDGFMDECFLRWRRESQTPPPYRQRRMAMCLAGSTTLQ